MTRLKHRLFQNDQWQNSGRIRRQISDAAKSVKSYYRESQNASQADPKNTALSANPTQIEKGKGR